MFYIISRYKSKKAFVPIGCKNIKYFPKKIFFGVKGVYGICLEKKVFLFSTYFVSYRLSPSTAERSCSSAFCKTARGVPTFSRMCPLPSGPNISPSLSASLAIDKKVDECIVFEVKPCTVEPYDKGCLRPDGFDVGNITIEKLFDK